jgi:hypothetical protein
MLPIPICIGTSVLPNEAGLLQGELVDWLVGGLMFAIPQ